MQTRYCKVTAIIRVEVLEKVERRLQERRPGNLPAKAWRRECSGLST
jgi:hypothetical protein